MTNFAEPEFDDDQLAVHAFEQSCRTGLTNPIGLDRHGKIVYVAEIASRTAVDRTPLRLRCPNRWCDHSPNGGWSVFEIVNPSGPKPGKDRSPETYLKHSAGEGGCGESMIHKLAKRVISRADRMLVPVSVVPGDPVTPTQHPTRFTTYSYDTATEEAPFSTREADLLLDGPQGPMYVEIRHTSPTPHSKIAEYAEWGVPVLEIMIKWDPELVRYFIHTDQDAFRDFVLLHARRRWLYHPVHEADLARKAAEETLRREGLAREHDANRSEKSGGGSIPEGQSARHARMSRAHDLPTIGTERASRWFSGHPSTWPTDVIDTLVLRRFQNDYDRFARDRRDAPEYLRHDGSAVIQPERDLDEIPHLSQTARELSRVSTGPRIETEVWSLFHDAFTRREGVRISRNDRSIHFRPEVVESIALVQIVLKLAGVIVEMYQSESPDSILDDWLQSEHFPTRLSGPGGGRRFIRRLQELRGHLEEAINRLNRGLSPTIPVGFPDLSRVAARIRREMEPASRPPTPPFDHPSQGYSACMPNGDPTTSTDEGGSSRSSAPDEGQGGTRDERPRSSRAHPFAARPKATYPLAPREEDLPKIVPGTTLNSGQMRHRDYAQALHNLAMHHYKGHRSLAEIYRLDVVPSLGMSRQDYATTPSRLIEAIRAHDALPHVDNPSSTIQPVID